MNKIQLSESFMNNIQLSKPVMNKIYAFGKKPPL